MAAIASAQEEIGLDGAAPAPSRWRRTWRRNRRHPRHRRTGDGGEGVGATLGSGPVIGRGSTLSPKLFELLFEAAERLEIEYTIEASGGAPPPTPTRSRSRRPASPPAWSVPRFATCITVEMVDLGDLEAVVELIGSFAESLHAEVDLSR